MTTGTLSGPYVGLDYFAEDDARYFFGRDGERKRIVGNLKASRLTLLYAESGVGKSSLLRAGVSARIREPAARRGAARFVPVVFSTWRGDATADLIAALEAAARPLLGAGEELSIRRGALDDAIEDVATTVDATPLLILDQFEEHFLYEAGDGFDDELARCVNRRGLRGHVLISIREDAYSLIGSRFKARIPNVYANFLHLDYLGEEAADEAIRRPIDAFNASASQGAPQFEIENQLIAAVIDQVQRGRLSMGDSVARADGGGDRVGVETAYLQLVMKRLWDEEVAVGSQRLRLETLRRLGGADTIVHGHLDEVMTKLPAEQRDAAAAALRFMVTSAGRKIALSSEELRGFSDVDAASLEPALEHLERERILRPIPATETSRVRRREIYHDVLAPAIREWRRAEGERRLEGVRRRARRLEVRNRILTAAVIALAALAVGLALYVWNPEPVRRLELETVDARFAVRGGRAPDPQLVLIAVDDRTLRRFGATGTGKLPRGEYARLLDRVRADQPAVIALDVQFSQEAEARGDRALLAAMKRAHDSLVVAYKAPTVVAGPDGTQSIGANLVGDPGNLARTGVRMGWAAFPTDEDGAIRRAEYLVDVVPHHFRGPVNVRVATFAFAAADVARDGELDERVADLPTATRRAWGEQTERSTWIDYAGPTRTVHRVSALDVLDGGTAEDFRGKLVVIGVTAREHPDKHATPFNEDRAMPGAEVQANAIATMYRDEPLRSAIPFADVLAIILVGALPALAVLSGSRLLRAVVIAAVSIAFLVTAQLAFEGGSIVAVVPALAALLVAGIGLATVPIARMVRRWNAARAPSQET